MATRDNENKQHNDASLEPRKKEQVKQTNKQTNDRRKNMTNPKSVEGQKEIIRRTRAEMSKTDFKRVTQRTNELIFLWRLSTQRSP